MCLSAYMKKYTQCTCGHIYTHTCVHTRIDTQIHEYLIIQQLARSLSCAFIFGICTMNKKKLQLTEVPVVKYRMLGIPQHLLTYAIYTSLNIENAKVEEKFLAH